MNQPSTFQLQNPLSPKKLWKKIIGNLIPNIYSSLILGFFIYMVIFHILIPLHGGNINSNTINFSFQNLIATFVIVFFLLIFLQILYIREYIKHYYYDCSDQFVTIKKGVFAPTEIHVQYQKIQDVYVDQDIIDRMMGLYDVHLASATMTSGIEAHIDGVSKEISENIKNHLLNKIKGDNSPSIELQNLVSPVSSSTFQANEKVSTDTYPISTSWIVVKMVNSFFASLFIFLFMSFVAYFSLESSTSILFFGSIVRIWIFIVSLISLFSSLLKLMLYKKNYHFELMPDYILLRTGVFNRQENHIPYKSIQNIVNNQSLLDRVFGLANLTIENASLGSSITIVGQTKEKAMKLNQILNRVVSSQGNISTMGL